MSSTFLAVFEETEQLTFVVSEELKRPLYRIGAEDLSTSAAGVESNLRKAFMRCMRWKSVLLIDEADIFLEERTVDSLERNEVVSSKFLLPVVIHDRVSESYTSWRRSLRVLPRVDLKVPIFRAY